MITEFERQIICSIIKGKNGITEITKDVLGENRRRQNYERVKYHLRILVDEGIIKKNGNGYEIPEWVDIGDATVELKTPTTTKVLPAGRTLFVNGMAGETPATVVVFLEERESRTDKK
jgi:hypothetical protein